MILKKIIESIVYSHLWIAACAAAMVLQTSFLLTGSWSLSPLVLLTFGGTLFIYAVHRLIGLEKLKGFSDSLNQRYTIIEKDQWLVIAFGVAGVLISAYYFFQLSYRTQSWLVVPGVVSLAYVAPLFGQKKRLRDIGLIKIFLIAITYAVICVLLVHLDGNHPFSKQAYLLFAEKVLFIFAITIPFDIRDLEVDKLSDLSTIPKLIGWQKAIMLSQFCLVLCAVLVWLNGYYTDPKALIALILSYAISSLLIGSTVPTKKDLFYSFGIDGLMVLQTFLLFAASLL